MTRGRPLLAGLALLVLTATPTGAHTGGSTGYATITIEDARVRYQVTLWPAALPATVGEQIRRAHAGDPAKRDRLIQVIREKVGVVADGGRCEPRPGEFRTGPSPGDSVILTVEFTCPGRGREVLIRDDVFDVLGPDHHTLARIDIPARTLQFAFSPDARETRVSLLGAAGGTASFVWLGIEHILTGWDHLLFLLMLLLRGGGWLSLLKIVTAFTIAHSITLSLAALDLVALPDRLVEAVIALSIGAVAAENLFLQPVVARRWLVSFCFGLVHGFGFSSALRELGLPRHNLFLSLFGFNAGVELGQAMVVAVALLVLVWLGRTRWEPRVIWSSSLAVLLVSLVLFVERAFL
jgi:HupE/UreJ protein